MSKADKKPEQSKKQPGKKTELSEKELSKVSGGGGVNKTHNN